MRSRLHSYTERQSDQTIEQAPARLSSTPHLGKFVLQRDDPESFLDAANGQHPLSDHSLFHALSAVLAGSGLPGISHFDAEQGELSGRQVGRRQAYPGKRRRCEQKDGGRAYV